MRRWKYQPPDQSADEILRLEEYAIRCGVPVLAHFNGAGHFFCPQCRRWFSARDFQGQFKARGGACGDCRDIRQREPINARLRFRVLARDNFTCQYCGRSAPQVELQVDHIQPVKHGGTNFIDNLLTACAECNIGKYDSRLD